MTDAIRLALGTLTALRVPPPRRVDAVVGGRAMALAPLVGLLLGMIAAGVGWAADAVDLAPLLVASLVVVVLAVLSRGLHLDGLSDTADGLGSGRRGADALAVMSKSDIGPFGVVTLVLVLLVQVSALAQLWSLDHGPAAVVVAVVAGRAALPLLCRRSVPAAKPGGLGAVVAGSVGALALLGALMVTLVICAVAGLATDGVRGLFAALAAVAVGLGVAFALQARCTKRFGGITGDVLGAAVEIATTAALLTLTIALS